jgi:hypothetical protein
MVTVNRYGRMAQRHWTRWLPETVRAIPDPETFFTDLGDQVALQIEDLAEAIAGEDPPGETYPQKVARLDSARTTAEHRILRQEVLLPPMSGNDDQPPDAPWTPVREDPADPVWQQDLANLDRTDGR